MTHSANNRNHTCAKCGRKFFLRSSLQTHVLKHAPLVPYDCHLCGQIFKEKSDFQKHLASSVHFESSGTSSHMELPSDRNYITNEIYKITKVETEDLRTSAERSTKDKSLRNYHSEFNHHGKGSSVNLEPQILLANPIVSSLQAIVKKTFKCFTCKEWFPNKDIFDKHSEKVLHHCEKCDKCYSSCHTLKEHQKNHLEIVECQICDKKCPSHRALKRHEVLHKVKAICSICGKHFANERCLEEHLGKGHLENEKVTCKICGEKFTRSDLVHHKLSHKQPVIYPCDVCNLPFGELHKLKNHQKLHETSEENLTCEVCGKTLSSRQALDLHALIHTGEKECSICSLTLRNVACLQRHMLTHSKEKRIHPKKIPCYICGIMYDRGYMACHIRSHLNEKCFTCEECGKGFVSGANLRSHMKIHNNDRKYQCEICDKRFITRKSLTVHTRRHTGDRPYKCDHCSKGFVTIWTLKNHLRLHDVEEPFICEICNKKFGQKKSLYAHYAGGAHTQNELKKLDQSVLDSINTKYVCTVCGKNCQQKTVLTIHMRTHNNEKPYECLKCKKSFRSQSLLKFHMRVHSGDYRSECTTCGKRFVYRWQGKRHMQTHHGQKSHLCNTCGKAFFVRTELKIHMKKHMQRKSYSCSICKQDFTVKKNFNAHQKTCLHGTTVSSLVMSKNVENSREAEPKSYMEHINFQELGQKDIIGNDVHSIQCYEAMPWGVNSANTQVIFSLIEDTNSIKQEYVIQEIHHSDF